MENPISIGEFTRIAANSQLASKSSLDLFAQDWDANCEPSLFEYFVWIEHFNSWRDS